MKTMGGKWQEGVGRLSRQDRWGQGGPQGPVKYNLDSHQQTSGPSQPGGMKLFSLLPCSWVLLPFKDVDFFV